MPAATDMTQTSPHVNPNTGEVDTAPLYVALHRYSEHGGDTHQLLDSIGGLPMLFGLLNATLDDSQNLQTVTSCIRRMVRDNPQQFSDASVLPYLVAGLQHADPRVQAFTIEQITNVGLAEPQWLLETNAKTLYRHVLNILSTDDSMEVVKQCTRLLVEMSAVSNKQYQPVVIQSVQKLLPEAYGPTIDPQEAVGQLRLFEVLLQILARSAPANNQQSETLIQRLITFYEALTTDPLSRVNVLELLDQAIRPTTAGSSQPSQPVALDNAVKLHIVDSLLLSFDVNDVMQSSLLLNGILRIVESVAESSVTPQQDQQLKWLSQQSRPKLLNNLASALSAGGDDTAAAQSLSTVSAVGLTYSGLELLASDDAQYRDFESEINPHGILLWYIARFVTAPSDLTQLAAMHSLSKLLGSDIVLSGAERRVYDEIDRYRLKLFDCIGQYAKGQPTTAILLHKVQLPFPQLKFKAIELMEAIATQRWGPERLLKDDALRGWLLNRTTDSGSINGLTAKFSVIDALCNNPTLRSSAHITDELRRQLFEYQQQGAFYKDRTARVLVSDEAA